MNELNTLWAKSNGETIRSHTDKLLSAFDDFTSLYGEYFNSTVLNAIRYACEYHDYGKLSYIFQKSIGNKTFINNLTNKEHLDTVYHQLGFDKHLPHGYLSPVFIDRSKLLDELGDELLICLYNAIYYHHNRDAQISISDLKEIVSEDLRPRFGVYATKFKSFIFSGTLEDPEWINYAVIIGLLNKFDYHASDNKEKLPVEIDGRFHGKYISDYVYEFITSKFSLRSVQEYTIENQNENLIITASTGIGKTEAALLWAGRQKLFYTLPLKVSINAMYERICHEYGYSSEKITLLHSDALSVLFDDNDNDDNITMLKYYASKRLSYPITVCTIDQLFNFIYKYRGSEILLATLKYSKVVIDEIQSYEPELIAKLIYGLKLISESGGKFSIITATLPPVLMYFIDKYKIPHKPQKQFLLNEKIRHKIHYEVADDFDYDKIIAEGKIKKVLVICNTVKRACKVYEKIHDDFDFQNVKLLHSNFMNKHRKMLENEIISFANDTSAVGIRISTQIVEASLDIDFDLLFTEMCTADSLLQRMGRCYRKRTYIGDEANIFIINNKSGYGNVYKYKDIFERSADFLQPFQDSFFCEADKMKYVDKVYDTNELRNSGSEYFTVINREIQSCTNIAPFEIDKATAKKKLRNILSYAVIPESQFNLQHNDFENAIDILRNFKSHSFEEKISAKRFIENNSINLGNYDKRSHERVNSLFNGLDYYTVNYKYDFDENTLCGKGLEYFRDEDSDFL